MILVDTNVLARGIEHRHVHQHAALASMAHLRKQQNENMVVCPQILMEFYSIATRKANSLGFTPDQALAEIAAIEQRFPVLLETPDLFFEWKVLVSKHQPTNRRVYDFRLVALMLTHNVSRILTFNDKDFQSIAGIEAVNPFDVLNLPRQ